MTIGRIPSVEGGIQPTIVDAKGDLIAGVAADSVNRLAVGSNDQVLVADSAASTGMAWKSVATPFAAGKNKIINGDFGIWQRGTTFTNPAAATYLADRFRLFYDQTGSTITVSQQAFTPGTAPAAPYESPFFFRLAISVAGSGGTTFNFGQRVEDVRTLSGQTATFSFWAKADAARTVTPQIQTSFGSGGSASTIQSGTSINLTTSWARYTTTFNVDSVSGKTIGAGSFVYVRLEIPTNTVLTIDTWGWQYEAGSVATPFQTATGTLQGELAACQRYYQEIGMIHPCKANLTTNVYSTIQFNPMRAAPTLDLSDAYAISDPGVASYTQSAKNISIAGASNARGGMQIGMANWTGLTVGAIYYGNTATVRIQLSAEL